MCTSTLNPLKPGMLKLLLAVEIGEMAVALDELFQKL